MDAGERRLRCGSARSHVLPRGGRAASPFIRAGETLMTILATLDHWRALFTGDYDSDSDSDDEAAFDSCMLSKPVVLFEVAWCLTFVLLSAAVILSSLGEKPSTPLRLWISVYSLRCLLHAACLCIDYRRHVAASLGGLDSRASVASKMESTTSLVSSIWWAFGLYWIVMGGQGLMQDSPRLYWLTVVYLGYNLVVIVSLTVMALVVFFTLGFCIPVATFVYSIVVRAGASRDDIRKLPKYRIFHDNPAMAFEDDMKQKQFVAQLESGKRKHVKEFFISPEDSECCICLTRYVDGAELYKLSCNHHFHCGCISKWLHISPTCPLCKFNILRNDTLV